MHICNLCVCVCLHLYMYVIASKDIDVNTDIGMMDIPLCPTLGSQFPVCVKTKKTNSARIQDAIIKVVSCLLHGLSHLQDHWFLAINAVGDALPKPVFSPGP